jgi:hypothetical protein
MMGMGRAIIEGAPVSDQIHQIALKNIVKNSFMHRGLT